MHKEGESLGRAIRKLLDPGEAPEDSSVLRRFNALATANGMPERVHYLRGIVQLLRAKGIPLDYAQLAVDLYLLQSRKAPRMSACTGERTSTYTARRKCKRTRPQCARKGELR